MPLFGHRHKAQAGPAQAGPVPPGFTGVIPPGYSGVAEFGAAQGWQPVPGQPFDGLLETEVHEIARAMYGAPRTGHAVMHTGVRVGGTAFPDAFRGTVDGRAVIVANAWTSIEAEIQHSTGHTWGTSVCAVEIPVPLPFLCIQSRRFPAVAPLPVTPTGNPAFDQLFAVSGVAPTDALDRVLTPEVQQRIMAHDDWVFQPGRYLLGCVGRGAFASAAEVGQRISEVLGIVTAFPAAAVPAHIDHSADDLAARIAGLTSMDEAMAFLAQLTPADREQLARSGSPLAPLADVRTPQEAMARFKSLDQPQKMQLMTLFMQVKHDQRHR